jgi:High potential iron-sulfur protein
MTSSIDSGRRAAIVRGARLAGFVIAASTAGRSAPAAAKASKTEMQYQEQRRDGKGCGDCKFFKPDGPNGETGECSIVEGAVRRDGWCTAFAPKT